VCVMVASGTPCLGPVTHAGCGALCPGYARGCYGCFGPSDTPRTSALATHLLAGGMKWLEVGRAFRTFNAWAPAFKAESERHG
jgi:sulfhydrogenase subunit delta